MTDAVVLPDPICDGSDTMRLALSLKSTFSDMLVYPHYGDSFLFVDGQCRFYATRGYMHGIRTGTLSKQREAALVAELGWTQLESWTDTAPGDLIEDGVVHQVILRDELPAEAAEAAADLLELDEALR